MLVGISEAIRVLFFNFSFIFFKSPAGGAGGAACLFPRCAGSLNNQTRVAKDKPVNIYTPKLAEPIIKPIFSLDQIKHYSTVSTKNEPNKTEIIFNQWLAGLIDGDGCFQLSKKGYASLEIVMETRDKHCLYLIKDCTNLVVR